MRALELKDFLSYKFLSNVSFAPDGKRAAFVVSNCVEEENCYESRLWLYDGDVRQLTDLGRERSFLWENEHCILFPAVRSAAEKKRAEAKDPFTAYYRLDLRGGEAVPAFTVPFAVSRLEKVPGGWAALGGIDVNYPDFYKMIEVERADVAKAYAEEADYKVLDEAPFWSNGGGFTNKKRTALFLIPDEGEICRISEPQEQVFDMAVWGDRVLYIAQSYHAKPSITGSEIWAVDVRTGKKSMLLAEPELRLSQLDVVGDQVWVRGTEVEEHGANRNRWVYRLDPLSCVLETLREEEYNMYSIVGSDCRYGGGQESAAKGGSLYHTTTREGSSHLYCLSPDGESRPVVTKEGSIDCIALSEYAEEALLVAMYDGKLQELYAADLQTGAVRQLSRFNEQIPEHIDVAEYEPLTVESCGLSIGGWILKPRNYDPRLSYPAILDIHGGPKTVYGPVFCHEMQLWSAMGYFVFFCNPKGSDGRTNDFMDIRGHYGETDYQNLMDFTDAVLERYPQIERKKVCVTGGSYGGFMTNWIIGHTDRFCCAASQRSISNWLSFYGVSDIGWFFAADQCDANIYDSPEKLWAQSPLKYAANVKTPTLFIHSDEDYRCPLEQGLQMYTALVDRGIPARMCLFHGENHELSRSGKPKHRVRRLKEITDWFEQYCR